MELSRQLTAQDQVRKLREIFEACPEPDAAMGPSVSVVRFQLPTGKKLSRRFLKTDTVQVGVVAWMYTRLSFNPHFNISLIYWYSY